MIMVVYEFMVVYERNSDKQLIIKKEGPGVNARAQDARTEVLKDIYERHGR